MYSFHRLFVSLTILMATANLPHLAAPRECTPSWCSAGKSTVALLHSVAQLPVMHSCCYSLDFCMHVHVIQQHTTLFYSLITTTTPQAPFSLGRHPDYHSRISFTKVLQSLKNDQSSLLQMDPSDKIGTPLSLTLGAPLEHGQDLHKDLQDTYKM